MTIEQFNNLSPGIAKETLYKCCGSSAWVKKLIVFMPFNSVDELKDHSDKIWRTCHVNDWLEAFSQHPKIGDVKSLEKKFAETQEWASNEQSGVNNAGSSTLQQLADGNEKYENKFGFIFIVCATGKSAEEMLQLLNKRLLNSPETEIKIAAEEQNKITHLRIDKLFS